MNANERIRSGWWLTVVMLAGGLSGSVHADGFIVVEHSERIQPRPTPTPRHVYMPLKVKYHHVDVAITDNAAVTKIDQTFTNPGSRQLEGTYIFPFADDVAVQQFSMYMDGKEVQGEVLGADKARNIYEDIVRKMKDPALLEYVGSRMFKARVFPIPARGDVRIKLEYAQTVPVSAGVSTYTYPLNTEKFSAAPLEDVAVRVRIQGQRPLTSVFCPSHKASVDRKGPNEAVVGYEDKNVLPDKDFIVTYQASDETFSLVMLTHRDGDEPGYFMARLAPSTTLEKADAVPKDIAFVIDTSGSMSGTKIEQARDALTFCLDNLNKEDRFNVITFSTETRPYRDSLIDATRDNIKAARKHVSELKAIGGTAINEALLTALDSYERDADSDGRPFMIVFLTDGLPTIGERDIDKILANVKDKNPGNVRLFVFGVGHDVNTQLLDKLAEENHGAREYVSENEDLELKLSGFYTMIASPVLSDLKITFGGAEVEDVFPKKMPDLFKGSELVLFGRYAGAGKQTIKLEGRRGKERVERTWDRRFPKRRTSCEYIPRLWASRKIGFLLDEIRLHGEDKELEGEIVRLAKRFGILTPYTSFLVIEADEERLARGERAQFPEMRERLVESYERSDQPGRLGGVGGGFGGGYGGAKSAYSDRTGERAVRMSKGISRMKDAKAGPANEPAAPVQDEAQVFLGDAATQVLDADGVSADVIGTPVARKGVPVRYVGSRTFYLTDGKWVDSRWDSKQETTKLTLFSDTYFKVVAEHADASKCFALGSHVIVVLGDNVYETVEES